MRYIRRIVAQMTGRGQSAIRFQPALISAAKEAKKHLTRATIRQKLKEGGCKLLPMKKRSYKIIYRSENRPLVKGSPLKQCIRLKSCNFVDRMKDKTITDKQRWIFYVRAARRLLREYKTKLGSKYQLYRKRVKGGLYRKDIRGLTRHLEEL